MSSHPKSLWHLTINTGDTRKSYRREVSDAVLAHMRGMNLLEPEADLPVPDYRLKTTRDSGGAVFTVFREQMPLVHCILAIGLDDADYWMIAERMYLKLTDQAPLDWALPEKPVSTPWLAVILLGGMGQYPEAAQWLGDFERCMAWLLIEESSVN